MLVDEALATARRGRRNGSLLLSAVCKRLGALSSAPRAAERPVRQTACNSGEVHVTRTGADVVIVCAIVLSVLSCTWVPLTDEGQNVRVLQTSAIADCKKVGRIGSKTTDHVVIFARSDQKVREELKSLARNEASGLGGDAIVPIGTATDGRQSFDIYRCETP